MAALKLSLANLSPREQRLVTVFGVFLAVVLGLGLPVGLEIMVLSRRSDNAALREAIAGIQAARSTIRERQSRRDSVLLRYASKAPVLAGFIEQTARSQKLDVTDSQDRQPLPIGKKYTERTTVVHFKKAGMYNLAKFLETLEGKGHALRVARLNIRKRTAEPDSYDVEVGVTAWDRIEPEKPAPAPDKDKGADKDKKEEKK